ncbi:Retrovirus-related Pol polyprotein from transposon TNT 1-94 [Ceratobasidium sp. AG-Ba]|nr:Retrovirus-related Pol polyprotein from transposon TNT 1-94 [Ceratobasidium sp. AG-Ba]
MKFQPPPEATEPDNNRATACVPVEGEKEPESEPKFDAESEPEHTPARAVPTVIVKTAPETPSAPTKVAMLPPLPAIVERLQQNLPPVHNSSKRKASNKAVKDYAHVVSKHATFDNTYSLLLIMDLAFEATTDDPNNKPTYHVVMKGVDCELWQEATEIKVAQLKAAGTIIRVDLPAGKKAIECGWVLNCEHNANGNFVQHKTQLVAKGYSQVEGIDYHLTFVLVL